MRPDPRLVILLSHEPILADKHVGDDLGVIRMDLRTTEVQEVRPAAHDTMAGGRPVGSRIWHRAYRLMRWKLSSDGREVRSSETLERGTEMVRNPTTGAILDGKFYFIANTGIANLDDGKIVDPTKLEPLQIGILPLE